MTEASHTLELDPVSPTFNTVRAEIFYYARQYDEAIEQANLTLKAYPNFPLAHFWLGSAYRDKKMYGDAVREFQRARELWHDNPAMVMAYGHSQGLAGETSDARSALTDLRKMSRSRYVPAIYFAAIYLGLGDKENTFAALEKTYQERNDRLIYLGVDPIADPLRSDSRFRDLLRRIGVPDRARQHASVSGVPPHM